MLCGVFAVHFTSLHSFVVVVVSVPVEKEQGWPPAPEAPSALYPDDLMLAHRGYQDFRFQFESPFCSAQTASLANCGAGDLSK